MLSSLMLVLLTQFTLCSPGETSRVCSCKAGMVSACVSLAGEDALAAAQALDEIQDALEQPTSWMADKNSEHLQRQLQAAARSLSQSTGSGEPPDCKGQKHHPISRPIAKKLSTHPTLKGLYAPRDPRFVTQAKDERDHCGYQEWHRDVDKEVIEWLDRTPRATPRQFMDKLREIYGRPEMKARFPHGF